MSAGIAPDPLAVPGAEFRTDIQGLRGVAVLLVVLYHAGLPFLTGGFIGVDVFFVVSGYVITGLLYRELQSTGRLDLPRFYGRRIRRLLPAAALVLAVTFAVFWLVYSPVERQRLSAVTLATALYVSNAWFALYATDYLGGDASSNPLLHTWSLAVEEQFYLVWPLALLLLARSTRSVDPRKRVVLGIAVLSLASFAGAVVATGISQPWAFFGSPTRAWEFGAGALAYFGWQADWGWPKPARVAVAAAGLLLVIGSAVALTEDSLMPGFVALACVAGTVAIIVAARPGDPGIRAFLATGAMVWLGDLSYGWYLWHWPVLVAIRELAPGAHPLAATGGVVLSLLLAWAMYRTFENPIRHNRFLSTRPRASIAMGIAITFVSAGVAYQVRERARDSAMAVNQIPIKRAQADVPAMLEQAGCHAGILQVEARRDCIFGRRESDVTVVLFGDSHAQHWFPAVEQLALEHGWALLSLTKSGCPSVTIEPYLRNYRRAYRECTQWRSEALRAIVDAKPRLVILSNSYAYERFDYGGKTRDAAWAEALDRTLQALEPTHADVLVLRDTPSAPFDIPTCLSRAVSRGQSTTASCSFDRARPSNAGIFDAERRVASTWPQVTIADPTDALCPEPSCKAMRGDTIVFSDRAHMTTAFSNSLAPALYALLPASFRDEAGSGRRVPARARPTTPEASAVRSR